MEDKNSSFPMLCKTGCGFFASREGMCSVCYKQHISKMRERDDAAVTGGAAAALQGTSFQSSVPPSLSDPTPKDVMELSSGIMDQADVLPPSPLSTAQPTTTSLPPSSEASTPATSTIDASVDEGSASPADSPGSNKKRNRCHFCNKRVGLLGCECRCGGVFCGLHRYSDTHNCPFDYKELAQSEIRKNNPQISSKKIDRI